VAQRRAMLVALASVVVTPGRRLAPLPNAGRPLVYYIGAAEGDQPPGRWWGPRAHDPQIEALDAVATVKDEDLGLLRMQNVMFRLSESPGEIRFIGRRLGQDNDEVYRERLGLGRGRIAELRAKGVI